jgi:hypothetical protein
MIQLLVNNKSFIMKSKSFHLTFFSASISDSMNDYSFIGISYLSEAFSSKGGGLLKLILLIAFSFKSEAWLIEYLCDGVLFSL